MDKPSSRYRLFWNSEENRLRAVWRLGIHTSLIIILQLMFSTMLFFFTTLIYSALGPGFQGLTLGSGPIALMESSWVNLVIVPLATFLAIFLATAIASRWIDRRPFTKFGISFGKKTTRGIGFNWLDFAFGLGLGALLMGLIFLIGWLTGSLRVTGFFVVSRADGGVLLGLLQAWIFFVFIGIYEELLSRGYHLVNMAEGFNGKGIGDRSALILAWLVSSLLFGFLHLGNPNATWLSVVNVSIAGILLGLGMVLTGSLAIPIGLHITWNFFQGNVFGFAVSGIETGVTVIAIEAAGNAWLMGGEFGPESGLVSLLAMLIGGLLTVLWIRRKGVLQLQEDLAKYQPNSTKE